MPERSPQIIEIWLDGGASFPTGRKWKVGLRNFKPEEHFMDQLLVERTKKLHRLRQLADRFTVKQRCVAYNRDYTYFNAPDYIRTKLMW